MPNQTRPFRQKVSEYSLTGKSASHNLSQIQDETPRQYAQPVAHITSASLSPLGLAPDTSDPQPIRLGSSVKVSIPNPTTTAVFQATSRKGHNLKTSSSPIETPSALTPKAPQIPFTPASRDEKRRESGYAKVPLWLQDPNTPTSIEENQPRDLVRLVEYMAKLQQTFDGEEEHCRKEKETSDQAEEVTRHATGGEES